MEKHLKKEELKSPDAFERTFDQLGKCLAKYRNFVLIFFVLICVVLLGFIFASYTQQKRNEKAADEFYLLQKAHPALDPINKTADDQTLDLDKVIESFEQFLQKHSQSSYGAIARLYLAKAYFQKGKVDQSLNHYVLSGKDLRKPYAYFAKMGQVTVYMQQEKWNESKSILNELILQKDFPLLDQAYYRLGLVHEAVGEKDQAKKMYENIKNNHPKSIFKDQALIRLSFLN